MSASDKVSRRYEYPVFLRMSVPHPSQEDLDTAERSTPVLIAGFGQRAFNPHTTRCFSQFMACDRCHSVGDPKAPDNAKLLDITHGFGSERFPLKACDVTNDDDSCDPETDHRVYQLDQIQTRDGKPLVVIGHPEPNMSRVLSLEEIEAMRAITVPKDAAISTESSPGAISDPTWPRASNLE